MQDSLTQHKQNASTLLLYVSVIDTIMTYSTDVRIVSIANTLMPILWISCLFLRVLECGVRGSFSRDCRLMIVLFLVYYAKSKALYYLGTYSSSGLGPARSLYLCLIFYYIGYTTNNIEVVFDRLLKIYLIVTTVLGLELAFVSLSSDFLYWEYQAERSATTAHLSVLVGISAILLLFYFRPRFRLAKLLMMGVAIVLLVSMIMLHTRTPVLSASVCIVCLFLQGRRDLKQSIRVFFWLFVALIIGILSGFWEQMFAELFPRNMDTSIRGIESLNTFSSGRMSVYTENWNYFLTSPLLGAGNWAYADNFALYVLGSGGLLSAALLFPIAYYIPLKSVFAKNRRLTDEASGDYRLRLQSFAAIIAIYYSLVSITEASPPLGTGSMVFLPWIVYGMLQRNNDDESMLEEYDDDQ